VAALTDIKIWQDNGLSATQVSIPFVWAQHLHSAFFKSKPRSIQFLVCTWVTGEIRERMIASSDRIQNFNSWPGIICLRYASDELACRIRMLIHRSRQTSNYGLYQPDGRELWRIYHYLGLVLSPWPGRGAFASRLHAVIWAANGGRFHQLGSTESGDFLQKAAMPTS